MKGGGQSRRVGLSSGFSLTEVIIAVAILAFALTTMAASMLLISSGQRDEIRLQRAEHFADLATLDLRYSPHEDSLTAQPIGQSQLLGLDPLPFAAGVAAGLVIVRYLDDAGSVLASAPPGRTGYRLTIEYTSVPSDPAGFTPVEATVHVSSPPDFDPLDRNLNPQDLEIHATHWVVFPRGEGNGP